jgi:multidrug efflux pump subunit AcrB
MIRIALKNPHLIIVVALAVFVVGVASYEKIPADLLPIFKTPAVQIVTFYPGMPPEVMERDIMSRMQRWTGQSVGIEHQEGKAMLGVCIVKDYFREDISMDTAMSQVTSYAMSDLFYLPPGTIPPMVMPFDPTASVPLCLVAISSPTMSEKELYDVAYFELRNRLQSIQGVIAPAVYGGKLRRIMAYVDRDKLEARGLSIMNVVQALRNHNVLIPAGNAKMGTTDYQIFTNALPDRVDDLNLIPIKVVNGSPVLLRDVGEVRDAAQIQTNIVRTNGRREVYIPIYRQPGANTIEIVDAIKAQLDQILRRLREMDPRAKDLVLSVVMDQSVGVRQSIQGLQVAAGLGALLAGGVVLLFLRSLRSTLIIVLAIPLSILAAVIGLFYTGDTVNAMTLGGLALAVGILVDQSIVVLENIVRHARMGKPSFQAALEGTQEVAMPILVSTITFIVVFYPVVFLSGLARFLFTPLAVAATIAIIASYLMSITLVPAYCAKFLRVPTADTNPKRERGNLWSSLALRVSVADWYGRLLSGVLRVRYLVVLVTLAAFMLSVPVLLTTGQELFPSVDAKQFTMFVRMPSGTRLEVTEETIHAVEQELVKLIGEPDPNFALGNEQVPASNMQIMISNMGVLMDWPAAYTPNTGPMDAFVLVQLKGQRGKPNTFQYVQQLREKLPSLFPGVEFSFDTGGMLTAALNMGEPAPIHFQVAGSNLESSLQIAQTIQREAQQVAGVADVRIAQRLDYPIIHVDMDKTLAQLQGVTTADVMQNLVSATNSSINFDPAFWIDPKNGNHYFIGAQYREEDINSLDTLRDVPITGSASVRPALLRNVAEFRRTTGPAVINHHNITRVIDVYANVLSGHDAGSAVRAIENRLRQNADLAVVSGRGPRGEFLKVEGDDFKGKGYTIQMAGEVRAMRESFRQFAAGLVIAAILVYLAMVAQFRSFLDPFVILLTVPLGFIGVAVMLFLTQTPLSIQVFMGIIMMVGIVVEYSIILIDFANSRVTAGMPVREAIIEAAQVRLRPILMTSITTWLALVPMAIGFGGGDANVPLARTIIGGVLGATALTLVVVPCLYVMLKRPRPARLDTESVPAMA